ncbi:hypothetical protein [Chroococcidiopsis sp.]
MWEQQKYKEKINPPSLLPPEHFCGNFFWIHAAAIERSVDTREELVVGSW